MRVLNEKDGRVILRSETGTIIIINEEGFTVKNIPDRQNEVKTTEWTDWLLLNDVINYITQGQPKRERC